MKQREYRFFYHFFKQKGKMSIHFRNSCTQVDDIKCDVPCETKWNKKQPYLVMQGFAQEVIIKNKIAYIL
jgi:hypothetical protein